MRGAVESARKYREMAPTGALAARALAIATIAEALARKKNEAVAGLAALRKSHPQSPELGEALYELGTIAFSKRDFEFAERLFGELAGLPKESRCHSQALADLGWSQQKQKKFAEAAAALPGCLTEHPDDALVPEAAFMRGEVAGRRRERSPRRRPPLPKPRNVPGSAEEDLSGGVAVGSASGAAEKNCRGRRRL